MLQDKTIVKFNFENKPITFTCDNVKFHSPYINETTIFRRLKFDVIQCGKCGVYFNIFTKNNEDIEYCPFCGARKVEDYAGK